MKNVERVVIPWSIEKIYQKRDSISCPDFQREPKLWKIRDKQLLIDSIFNDIDIPKLYFSKIGKEEYEVIDGQQRLWAIWEFIDNEYDCKLNSKSYKFRDLNNDIELQFLNYEIQIVEIKGATKDYLRELFLRLQLGLLLITGEKLHAKVGYMKDFVFNEMNSHKFIQLIKIPNHRYAKQTLCAQIVINSFYKEKIDQFSGTRYEDLKIFFEQYQKPEGDDLIFFKKKCRSILKVLNELEKYFGEKIAEIKNRSLILSIYLFVEFIMNADNVIDKKMPKFVEFVIKLWKRIKEEDKAGFDRKNKELYIFKSHLNNAPGERYQIQNRHEKLLEYFEHYLKTNKIKGDS